MTTTTTGAAAAQRGKEAAAATPWWRRRAWTYGLVALLAVLAFAPTARYGFTFDDHTYVEDNPHLRDLSGLWRGFLASFPPQWPEGVQYRPLLTTTLTIDYAMARPTGLRKAGIGAPLVEATPFHVTNIALHGVASLLAVGLAAALLGRHAGDVPLLTGALFAVHPVHVEAVANVSGRAEVQTAVAVLAAAWLFWRHEPGRAWQRSPALWGAVAAYAAALFTKESGVTFLPMLVGMIWMRPAFEAGGRGDDNNDDERQPPPTAGSPARWALLLPFVALTLLYLVCRVWVLGRAGMSEAFHYFPQHPDLAPAPTMAFAALIYHLLFLAPIRLNPDYEFPVHLWSGVRVDAIGEWNGWALAGGVLVVVWLVAFGATFVRRSVWALPLGFTLAGLSVYTNIVPFGDWVAERFLYLPSFGLCLLAAMTITRIGRTSIRAWTGGAIIALLLVRTWFALPVWANPASFIAHSKQVTPEQANPYYASGQRLLFAASERRVAAERADSPAVAETLRAEAQQFYEAARAEHLAALERDPMKLSARQSLLEIALRLDPWQPDLIREQYDWVRRHAIVHFEGAPSLWLDRARVAGAADDWAFGLRLVRAARRGFSASPAERDALADTIEAQLLHGRGLAAADAGRPPEALADLGRALELDPQPIYRRNAALYLERLGQREAARQQWSLVLRQDPINREAREALARLGGE